MGEKERKKSKRGEKENDSKWARRSEMVREERL